MVEDRGITPAVEMASFVGLKPTIEWIAAGAMMEPVVSVPIEGIVGLAGLGAVAARHLRVHEVCELRQVRLAQNDGAAVRQGRYYVSVVFWREVLERVGAAAGGHGVRVDVVFDEDGDSPHARRSCGARVEGAGFLYRLRIDRRYCVDALFTGIVCFDAIQVERRQFFVGQVAF